MTNPTYSWAAGPAPSIDLTGTVRPGPPTWELQSISNRSLTVKLNDVSSCSFTVNGDTQDATQITDLLTDITVSRNGVNLHRGRVTNTVDAITETGYNLQVTTSDYIGLLDRRLIQDGDQTFTNVEQSSIITSLLNYTQNKPNGDLGIRNSASWPTTGVVRTQTFTNGSSIWQAIQSLTAMDGGVDFSIDNNLTSSLTYPATGVYKGTTLAYGGNVTQAQGTTDHSQYMNVVVQTGGLPTGGSGANPVSVVAVSDIKARPEGRWEAALSNPELTTSAATSAAGTYYLNRYGGRVNTMWQLTMAPGAWLGPSSLWVGDIVLVSIHRGRRMVDQQFRVYELDISVDQNNVETVSTTVGTIVPNDRSVLTKLAKKLNYLAKQ